MSSVCKEHIFLINLFTEGCNLTNVLFILCECSLWFTLVGGRVHCHGGGWCKWSLKSCFLAAKGRSFAGNATKYSDCRTVAASVAVTAWQLSMLISKCFIKHYSNINFTAWDLENPYYGEGFPIRLAWHNLGFFPVSWYVESLGTSWPSFSLFFF